VGVYACGQSQRKTGAHLEYEVTTWTLAIYFALSVDGAAEAMLTSAFKDDSVSTVRVGRDLGLRRTRRRRRGDNTK
jgi:hypothetical protein